MDAEVLCLLSSRSCIVGLETLEEKSEEQIKLLHKQIQRVLK